MEAARQNSLNGWKKFSCYLLKILALIMFGRNSDKFKNATEKFKRWSRQILLKFGRTETEDIEANFLNP